MSIEENGYRRGVHQALYFASGRLESLGMTEAADTIAELANAAGRLRTRRNEPFVLEELDLEVHRHKEEMAQAAEDGA
jgi:hypothetical protein